MAPNIIIIAGPTASGKSALALEIAQKSPSVIINADSQQLYRELRILTARPTTEEETRVSHKLYGTMPASESCSAGQWLIFAQMEIDWALSQGVQPIVVGGTGLYLSALRKGIASMPAIAPEIRRQASCDYDMMGKEAFTARLRDIDSVFFERLRVHDRQRLIRAYEVWLGSGKTLSWWQARPTAPPYTAQQFTVHTTHMPRDALYARCDARIIAMVEQGVLEEVQRFLTLNLPVDAPAMKSVGVREFSAYIRGDASLDQAIRDTQAATRQYAKRQMTWFRTQWPE